MLVLSRKRDEMVIIGGDLVVQVVDIRGDKVRLGIQAPKDVIVDRMEIWRDKQRELAALSAAEPGAPRCNGCGTVLDLHQPVATDPNRLLGTCPECGAWIGLRATPHGTFLRATVPGLSA